MWWCSLVALCAEEELQVSWDDWRLLGGHTVATGGCPVAGASKGESIDWNQPSDYSVNICCQYLRGPTTTAFWI